MRRGEFKMSKGSIKPAASDEKNIDGRIISIRDDLLGFFYFAQRIEDVLKGTNSTGTSGHPTEDFGPVSALM